MFEPIRGKVDSKLFKRNIQNRMRPKGVPLSIISGFVRRFFKKFLMSPEGLPFNFLIFLHQNNCEKKSQRVPSFRFFGTMRQSKFSFFSKLLKVSKVPLQLFYIPFTLACSYDSAYLVFSRKVDNFLRKCLRSTASPLC